MIIKLPLPSYKGEILEKVLLKRRSVRKFKDKPLDLNQISMLLWAGYGKTEERWGLILRTSPSAGATYPCELFISVKRNGVESLKEGVYHYIVSNHSLKLIKEGDVSFALCDACLGQMWVREAPVNIIITADYKRTTARYMERGVRYVHMEVGHIGQNIYLEAISLKLGTVAVGAFYDEEVKRILSIPKNLEVLYVMPVGYPD